MDGLKALACLMIVLHHLAFYGPMSTVAYPLFPGLIDWFYEYGRMAVQAFIVMAGFLMAKKFSPQGESLVTTPLKIIRQRYLRLAIPYFAALILAIVCAALARALMEHESVPLAPSIPQLVAHVLLLQDLLDQEALSAGVWYIAIDFQLFALSILMLWLPQRLSFPAPFLRLLAPLLVATLTLASLFVFNLDEKWDETALYFFGAYGLGVLAYWASSARYNMHGLTLLGTVVVAALLVEFRERIAVAGAVMLLLGYANRAGVLANWPVPWPLIHLGKISFSIFLTHFPLILLVNAAVTFYFPNQPVANTCGLILAVGISIRGGGLFYKWVESRSLTNI